MNKLQVSPEVTVGKNSTGKPYYEFIAP